MITRLSVENWRAHKKSELTFGKGTNVLIGPIGAGKSSLMDALCFGLYGTFPHAAARKASLEETISSKPHEEEQARVEVEFTYGGDTYRVERLVHRKGANEGRLYKNGKLVAGPKPTTTTGEVERLLEVDYDLFSRAVYSEQNQIDYFLKLSPGQRREKFDELLDIKRYEKARGNAVTAGNRLKKLAEDKEKWVEEQKARLREGGVEEAKRKLAALEGERKELLEGRTVAEKELREREAAVAELRKKEESYRLAKERVTQSRGKVEALEADVAETRKRLQGKSAESLKKSLEAAAERQRESKAAEEKAEATVREAERKLKEADKALARKEEELRQIEAAGSAWRGAGGVCPVCRRDMDEHTRASLKEEDEQRLAAAKEEEAALHQEVARREKEKEAAKEKEKALAAEGRELEEGMRQVERDREAAEALARKEAECDDSKKALAVAGATLAEMRFDEEALGKERERLAEARGKKERLQERVEALNKLADEIVLRIGQFEESRQRVVELEETCAAMRRGVEKLAVYTNALKATQAGLREALVNNVNEAMAELWERLYPYKDFVGAKITIEDGDYEIKVKTRLGKWTRVEGMLSGGERSAVALTLRMAVSLVLTQNLSWLILDEPTHNLDARTVQELSGMMRTHLPGLVEQVFLITHDKELERAASAALYVLERDKEVDGATRVETVTGN